MPTKEETDNKKKKPRFLSTKEPQLEPEAEPSAEKSGSMPDEDGFSEILSNQIKRKAEREALREPQVGSILGLDLGMSQQKQGSDIGSMLGRALAGLAPIAAGALMGGKEGAAIGAGVGSEYLKDQSDKDYKASLKTSDPWLQKMLLSDQLQKGRMGLQFGNQKELQKSGLEGRKEIAQEGRAFTAEQREAGRKAADTRTDKQIAAANARHGASLEERRGARGFRESEAFRQSVNKYSTRIINDPVIKESEKKDIAFDGVFNLVGEARKGNTIAANSLGATMARAIGEVGVLTDVDVKRYIESGQITRAMVDRINRIAKGAPSDLTLQEIEGVATLMKNVNRDRVQGRKNRYIREFANNFNVPVGEAATLLQQQYEEDGHGVGGVGSTGQKRITAEQYEKMSEKEKDDFVMGGGDIAD